MKIERLSIRQLTIGVIALFGFISIIISFFASTYFLNSALKYQYHSFARVIQIGSQESVNNLRDILHKIASTLATNRELGQLMEAHDNVSNRKKMQASIDDIIRNGFVDVAKVNLLAIRLYSIDLKPLVQSQRDELIFTETLPEIIRLKASNRNSVERFKAIFDFWTYQQRPYFSILIPVGGFKLKGYMELLVDPVFNLRRISGILQMPIKIVSVDGQVLYEKGITDETLSSMHPIEYELRSSLYEPIVKIVAYTEAESLKQELIQTQAYTTLIFLALTMISLLFAMWIFKHYLFDPLSKMITQIKLITEGSLQSRVAPFGLKEFSLLANNFNIMTKRLHERTEILDHLSKNDALTGIPNRRYFEDTFEREFYRSKRNNTPLGLLILDIDFFKKYNDHYGHQQGDHCLQKVAQSISNLLVRPGDFIARYGGEEFVIILPDTDQDGVHHIAEQVRSSIWELKVEHASSQVCDYVTVSIGGAVLSGNNFENPEALLKQADDMLYQAKEESRNKVIIAKVKSLPFSQPIKNFA